MALLIVFVMLLFNTVAFAQADDLAARRARSLEVVTQQRNQAMDALAQCVSEYSHQLEQLRKTCPAAPPAESPGK